MFGGLTLKINTTMINKIISTILLLCSVVSLSLVFISSSTYELTLAMALAIVAGSLGLAIAKE